MRWLRVCGPVGNIRRRNRNFLSGFGDFPIRRDRLAIDDRQLLVRREEFSGVEDALAILTAPTVRGGI